jgi:translation initiation factor 1
MCLDFGKKPDDLDNLFGISDQLSFLGKESSKITIYTELRKGRRIVTIIKGIQGEKQEIKDLVKRMKKSFGCGGSIEEDGKSYIILLQGDHRKRVYDFLKKEGYKDITVL